MDENPFRKSPLPPLPPITQAEYLSFLPPPSPQEIRAEQMRYRQQKRKQLIQLGYNEEQIIFSDEDEDSYEEDPSSSSFQESYSESESSCGNDIRNCGRKVNRSYSSQRQSHPMTAYKKNRSNSKPISTQKQQINKQSQSQSQLDQQTQKLLLIHEYLQVSAFTERMIFSPKINKLLTSDQFVDSHSLAQIQQYINSLVIPSAPSWQQQINTRQARGEGQFVSQAAMWDLQQKILQLIREQQQKQA